MSDGSLPGRPLKCDADRVLAEIIPQLPAVETELLARISQRLLQGLRDHGFLAAKLMRKDWRPERREEAWDWLVYHELTEMQEGR